MSVTDIVNELLSTVSTTDKDLKHRHLIDRVQAWLLSNDVDGEVSKPTLDGGDPVVSVPINTALDAITMKTTKGIPKNDQVYGEINEEGLCVYTASRKRIAEDSDTTDTTDIRITSAESPFFEESPALIIIDGEVYHTPYADLIPGAITDEPEAGFVEDVVKNGIQEPIIVGEIDGDLTILDGHTRLSVVEIARGEGVAIPFEISNKGDLSTDEATKRAVKLNTQARKLKPSQRQSMYRTITNRLFGTRAQIWTKTGDDRSQQWWAKMMGVTAATVSNDFRDMGIPNPHETGNDKHEGPVSERIKSLTKRKGELQSNKAAASLIRTHAQKFEETADLHAYLTEYQPEDVKRVFDDVKKAIDQYRDELTAEMAAITKLIESGTVPEDDDELSVAIAEAKAQALVEGVDGGEGGGKSAPEFREGDLFVFRYNTTQKGPKYRFGYVWRDTRSDGASVDIRSFSPGSKKWVDVRKERAAVIRMISRGNAVPDEDARPENWHKDLGQNLDDLTLHPELDKEGVDPDEFVGEWLDKADHIDDLKAAE